MKVIFLISAIIGLPLATAPAAADHDSDYSRAEARLAKKIERIGTFLPRRYQTANVFDAASGPGQRKGAAWLIRSKNGIQGRIMSNVPTSGDPYTLWIVVFNNPSACEGPCDDPDLENPDVKASVFNASGAISADNGTGGGVVNLDFTVVAGNLARNQFVLLGEGGGLRRNRGYKAQVALVIDQHPSISQGPDSWIGDLTTTNFPGAGPAVSNAFAIFVPCPKKTCPASVL